MLKHETSGIRRLQASHWHYLMKSLVVLFSFSSELGQAQSATVSRDPVAIQTLQSSLAAMGGQASWSSVRSFSATATETHSDGTTQTLKFADDWSSSLRLYREHDEPTGKVRKYVQESSKVYATNGSQLVITKNPVLDPVLALAGYAPGTSIAYALSQPSYAIRPSQRQTGNTDETCITIIPPTAHTGRTTICISKTTSLPSTAYLDFEDLITHSSLDTETIKYANFRQQSGLLTPAQFEIRLPNGTKTSMSITNMAVSPSINFAALEGALQ